MRMRLFCAAAAALTISAGNFSLAGNSQFLPKRPAANEPPVMKMSTTASIFSDNVTTISESVGTNVQKELDSFLATRGPASKKTEWEVKPDGKIEFDKNLWSVEKDAEGSEVFTVKKLSGARAQKRTVIRNDDQSIRTISEYRLASDDKEDFWFVFFLDQKLAAATTCTNKTSDGLRSCVTAIPSVCKNLPASKAVDWTLPKSVIPDVDMVEKRAIATVIAMRGDDHQIENMAKTGNLIGLKHKLQTTRGRLTSAPVKSEYIKEASDLCARANFDTKSL